MEENYIVLNYTHDEYNDENIIRAPVMASNPKIGFTYYKIRKANSRQITEYY